MTKHSVLPANKSLLESGLESAFTKLLDDIPSIYPDLLNANKVDAQLLPYLAADRVVSEWDSSAPEAEQRKTAHNAWNVRRLAGTKAGIELGLDSVEYDCEILPWHQMTPKGEPYHFELVAWRRYNAPVNQDVVHRMLAHLEDAKSERDTYELTLAFGLETSLSVAAVIDPSVTIFDRDYSGTFINEVISPGGIQLAGAINGVTIVEQPIEASIPNDADCSGGIYTAGAWHMILITDISPEARL